MNDPTSAAVVNIRRGYQCETGTDENLGDLLAVAKDLQAAAAKHRQAAQELNEQAAEICNYVRKKARIRVFGMAWADEPSPTEGLEVDDFSVKLPRGDIDPTVMLAMEPLEEPAADDDQAQSPTHAPDELVSFYTASLQPGDAGRLHDAQMRDELRKLARGEGMQFPLHAGRPPRRRRSDPARQAMRCGRGLRMLAVAWLRRIRELAAA